MKTFNPDNEDETLWCMIEHYDSDGFLMDMFYAPTALRSTGDLYWHASKFYGKCQGKLFNEDNNRAVGWYFDKPFYYSEEESEVIRTVVIPVDSQFEYVYIPNQSRKKVSNGS